jgi:carboxymethylenebutenolidase
VRDVIDQRWDLDASGGQLDVYVFEPDRPGPSPAVVVYMDAFGIRAELASMATRLASHGFVVAVPNLYYRSGAFAPFDKSQVFSEGPERDRFKAMIASIDAPMVMEDTAVVMDRLDRHPAAVAGAPLGVVGYCMGGGYALTAAGTFPDRVAAAAVFHGGSLATDRASSPHLLAPRIRGHVYVGAAEIDPSFPADQQQRLREALEAAGVRWTMEIYEGARHGFAVTGHPVYDRDASERHWRRLIEFLDGALR